MIIAFATVAIVAVAFALGLRASEAGSVIPLLALGVPYAGLSIWAGARLWRDGILGDRLRPRSGDLAFGAFVATMLFLGAIVGRMVLAPHQAAREGWLMRVYLQIGNPDDLQRHLLLVTFAVMVVAALEEVTWRGLVYPALEEEIGTRRAWPATAALYAIAHLPTMYLLRDPFAGPNPLIVLAALGCGLVWGLMVARTGRLPAAIFSHALFTWAVAVQFPLWRLG